METQRNNIKVLPGRLSSRCNSDTSLNLHWCDESRQFHLNQSAQPLTKCVLAYWLFSWMGVKSWETLDQDRSRLSVQLWHQLWTRFQINSVCQSIHVTWLGKCATFDTFSFVKSELWKLSRPFVGPVYFCGYLKIICFISRGLFFVAPHRLVYFWIRRRKGREKKANIYMCRLLVSVSWLDKRTSSVDKSQLTSRGGWKESSSSKGID